VEGTQPPFGPIYNLSQDELAMFHEYLDENLDKGFIQIQSLQSVPLSSLLKRKMIICECVSIIVD